MGTTKSKSKLSNTSKRQRAQHALPRKSRRIPAASAETRTLFTQEGPAAPPPPIPQTGSWRLFQPSIRLWFDNYNTSLVLYILPLMTLLLGSIVGGTGKDFTLRTLIGLILAVIGAAWSLVNVPASYHLQLRAIRGERPGAKECYRHGFGVSLRLIGLGALVTALIIAGLLVFIVPGLILMRRYLMAPYYLIDQNLGIREAMQRSAADSSPVSWYIWGVYAVYIFTYLFCLYVFSAIAASMYSVALASFISNLYVFAPALRYGEIALRQKAIQPQET